ncbi:MAG: D-alanyl-D-alanine carboxypeptidase/D-alanyl-D-alanine-endopeptidase [Planctomycetes bacterium]|nr:D-alanyl-D-alanine carboxypeptidase/D-alanyl-D-alanine-endopeptidase [Planctomycetota bacterium]
MVRMVVVGLLAGVLPAQDLERAVQAAEALGARTGVAVADAAGRVWFQHRAGEVFAPASNMKVLTAAAVLQGLGADHRFATTFSLRAGRLAVTASGDPNWITGTADAPEVVFGEVASALQRRGVTALRGIDLEPGTFRGPSRPPTWPQDQLGTYYCAPTGPFVLDQGTFTVAVHPGRGELAEVQLAAPAAAVPLRGTIALADRAKGAVYGASDLGGAVQVRGRFYRKAPPVTIRAAVADPALWWEAALRRALAQAVFAVAADAAVAAADGAVHAHRTDLAAALGRMLEDSSNFDAEQCLRVLGHERLGDGSLRGGIGAMQAELEALVGALPQGVVLSDGSGLSRENRLTPGLLVAVLLASQRGAGGKALCDALPVAGRSGTLEGRFAGSDLVGRVRAKTGWIRGASALAGFVVRRDGSRAWFAILMNYDPRKNGLNRDLKRLQEQMVAAIDRLEAGR